MECGAKRVSDIGRNRDMVAIRKTSIREKSRPLDVYLGWKKYLYPYRPTDVGPDRPGDSFRIIVLPARAEGCPLFDRPKRGRKKPHQPALAHVRSRRRAGPRCGGRLGSASVQRIGTRFAQTSIRTAPRCAAWPPLAPHRERPGGGGQSSDEAANPGRVLFLVYLEKATAERRGCL